MTALFTAPVWNEMRGKNKQVDEEPKISNIASKNPGEYGLLLQCPQNETYAPPSCM